MSGSRRELRLTPEQEAKVRDELLGTCSGEELEPILGPEFEGVYLHDLSEQEIANATDGIERCDVCGWWVETIELDEDHVCEDCREDEE